MVIIDSCTEGLGRNLLEVSVILLCYVGCMERNEGTSSTVLQCNSEVIVLLLMLLLHYIDSIVLLTPLHLYDNYS